MISNDQKENIICPIDECVETFYGRHTAHHPAAVIANNNKSLEVPPSNQSREYLKLQRKKNTMRTRGKPNEQLSPKRWPHSYLT